MNNQAVHTPQRQRRLSLYQLPAELRLPKFNHTGNKRIIAFALEFFYNFHAGTEDRATQACDPSAVPVLYSRAALGDPQSRFITCW